jgi:hypothetical protein
LPKKVIELDTEDEDVSKEDYPDKDTVSDKFVEDEDDGEGVEDVAGDDSPAAELGEPQPTRRECAQSR